MGYGLEARGVEGHRYPADTRTATAKALCGRQSPANRRESAQIRNMLSPDYCPIDWHLDFKSGYRWNEATWYRDIIYGDQPGADVKVPWELARAQHLPLLAWCAGVSEDVDLAQACAREVRDQILDFMAANPPRFGVNWVCAMDVAIRVSNWLLARELLCAAALVLDDEFEALFARGVLEHGRHIRANLEWSPDLRGNHYFADVVGLLFVGASLPDNDEAAEWLEYARDQVLAEAVLQFWSDGSNFEGSTAYHRLSSEMLLWAVALIVGRFGAEAVPLAVRERLERAGEFAVDICRPDGHVVQFGDNDSGRFLKLGCAYEVFEQEVLTNRYDNLAGKCIPRSDSLLLEDHLDHRHLAASIGTLFNRADLAKHGIGAEHEIPFLNDLTGGVTLESTGRWRSANASVGTSEEFEAALRASSLRVRRESSFAMDARDGVQALAYPDFGFFLLRSARLWLAVRCGPIGQNGNGGHAHNDQLAVEFFRDGQPVWEDPGTYLYTALPERRNEYRSVHAHHAPRVAGREPGSLDLGLFRLGDEAQAQCVYFGARGFLGYHDGYGARVWRLVELGRQCVRIVDWVEGDALELLDDDWTPPHSRGYGWIERGGRA